MLCQAHNPLVPGSNPGGPTSKALCTWGFPSRRFRAGDSRGHASFGSREKQPKRRVGPWLASWRRSASGSGSARSPSLTGSGRNARAAAPRSRVVGLALRAKTPAESPKAPTRFDARGDEPRQTEFDLQGQDFVRIPGATFRLARPRADRAPRASRASRPCRPSSVCGSPSCATPRFEGLSDGAVRRIRGSAPEQEDKARDRRRLRWRVASNGTSSHR